MNVTYTDIIYTARDGVATITINRPESLNALRTTTVQELIEAFRRADEDPTIGVAVLTGGGRPRLLRRRGPEGTGLASGRPGDGGRWRSNCAICSPRCAGSAFPSSPP